MKRAVRPAAALLALTLALTVSLTGCIKSTTFNPYAPPDTGELDRLQQAVNKQADLEPTQVVLNQLETQIRAAIAQYSPQTRLAEYGPKGSLGACQDPNVFTVGQQYDPAPLSGEPAPDPAQWQHIVDQLKPIFEQAGFRPGTEAPVNGVSYGKESASVTLTNGGEKSPLMYKASTGCRLPAAWRTTSPPPTSVGTGEVGMHYPYLFGSGGGRTTKPVGS